ncbi:flippase [Anaerorhabdus furcosa]|uniref:Membrane protein involved in the export of O-antigen and teichoic acid n=1 Tax=Anaerorhabdus furcosa TaxID=118967 RepID=A0A1T4NCZ1_9FIRM|nr:flippase [Anaerorhabdus furcosa]SJZ77124.1 Membrane protein involved in the export of O-antigen and teichoic acid [Anaerorhabdus furcosa]
MKSSIKKNYIYSVLYQILIIIVPLITAPYLTRVMGAKKLGIYSYTNSVAYYFYLFAMLGISNYGNRSIASVRDDKKKMNTVFSELIVMQISFGIIVASIYILYLIYLYTTTSIYFIPSVIWSPYVISGLFDINWFFWGIEKFSITVFRNVVIKILTTIGIFLFVRSQNDINIYIALISGSFVLSAVVLWTKLHRYVSFKLPRISLVYSHFKSNFILFIPVIAVSIYTVMDKIMLGQMSGMQNLGFYDNVQKIMTIPTGLVTALGIVMLPRIANLVANGKRDEVNTYIDMSMQFSSFFSVAIAFGLAAIAPTFTIIYFGGEFQGTSFMMELFSITIIFIAWANVIRTQYLIPCGKDKIYILSVCVGAIVNLIVNLILIPRLKDIGAVVGTIFAEFVVAFIQTWAVRKELPVYMFFKNSIIFIIPGFAMSIFTRGIGRYLGITLTSLIVQVIFGIIVYCVGIGVYLFNSNSLLANRVKITLNKYLKRN